MVQESLQVDLVVQEDPKEDHLGRGLLLVQVVQVDRGNRGAHWGQADW